MKLMSIRIAKGLAHTIFWGWNGIFIAFVYFGLIPFELGDFLEAVETGRASVHQLTLLAIAAVIPVVSVILGGVRLRRRPWALLALFYGVEAPTMVLVLAHLGLARSLTLPIWVLLASYAVGALSLTVSLARRSPESARARLVHLTLDAAGLLFGLYVGGLLLFFVPPAATQLFEFVFEGGLREAVGHAARHGNLLQLLLVAALTATCALALALPVGMAALPILQWGRRFREVRADGRAGFGALLSALVATGVAIALAATLHQPQLEAFEATDAAPATRAAREAWRAHASTIRAGLANAYLAKLRYLDRDRDLRMMRRLYEREVGLDRDAAQAVQDAFASWARPFIFDDRARPMETAEAKRRYAAFLDGGIEKELREPLRDALDLGWNRRQPEAGPLDEGARRVHLERQEIRISPAEIFADVEIHEVYRNQTPFELEIAYGFELPPHAVLTGLWLGSSDDKRDAFTHVVAPRGAARRVYRAQVRRFVDPALLEQVGPRQYRLRIFPIPARDRQTGQAKPMHVWFTYKTLAGAEGWPAPRRLSARNVYWSGRTARSIDGVPADDPGDWLPAVLPFTGSHARTAWSVALAEDLFVSGLPVSTPPALPTGRRIGVVLDRSLSMHAHADATAAILERLKARLGPYNRVDVLLTSAPMRNEPAVVRAIEHLEPADLGAFGGQGLDLLFEQAAEHLPGCDAVVYVTDHGAAELDEAPQATLPTDAPQFVLSVSGHPATAYPDAVTSAVLDSGGDVVTSVDDLFARLAWAAHPPRAAPGDPSWSGRTPRTPLIGVSEGWAFVMDRVPHGPSREALAPLAASWMIRAHGQARARGTPRVLDRVHALAQRYSVLTPFSSLIVLVNPQQHEALRRASSASDRFDRSTEGEQLLLEPAGLDGGLSGAPEPATWALMTLAAGGIAAARRRRRAAAKGLRQPTESVLRRPRLE